MGEEIENMDIEIKKKVVEAMKNIPETMSKVRDWLLKNGKVQWYSYNSAVEERYKKWIEEEYKKGYTAEDIEIERITATDGNHDIFEIKIKNKINGSITHIYYIVLDIKHLGKNEAKVLKIVEDKENEEIKRNREKIKEAKEKKEADEERQKEIREKAEYSIQKEKISELKEEIEKLKKIIADNVRPFDIPDREKEEKKREINEIIKEYSEEAEDEEEY